MLRIATITTLCLMLASAGAAAEITLRAQAQAAKRVVTLGDVADVQGLGAESLIGLELVPAPSTGRTRSLQMREVQDLLALQGVKLVEHRFSGATSVQIGAGVQQVAATAPAVKASRSLREQTTSRVERAIKRYLQQVADDRLPFVIAAELSDEQLNALVSRTGEIMVSGGTEPWTGAQAFSLQAATTQGPVRMEITAHVSLPEMVVVAKRPFRKGEVVRASDVELQMPAGETDTVALATHLDDVVGRETLRSVATGQPIESAWVRKPVLVRRGEIVTVFARAANLTVRTQARATEDGGLNDTVGVERLDDRQRYTARVIGVQELDVMVGGARVTSTAGR